MKLGFKESQAAFHSGSQNARIWTEAWVKDQLYCPNCGTPKIERFPANSPVADFFCPTCADEYELKAQKSRFGEKVLDGAYSKKCERLAADNSPNLLLMNYDRGQLCVTDLMVVPKHFFVQDVIRRRPPLSATARRAGWVGSHILLGKIPTAGKIFIVRHGIVQPEESVRAQWQRTAFLRDASVEARGWLVDVMKCIETLGKAEFQLDDVYAFEKHLSKLYPGNSNVRPKIRQQLQFLRDRGYLDFVSRGYYRLK